MSVEPLDGVCPNLSGLYKMDGITTDSGGEQSRNTAHSALVLGKRVPEITSRSANTEIARGFIAIRINMTARDLAEIQTISDTGKTLAVYEMGPRAGWGCSRGRFVWQSETVVGGEATQSTLWMNSQVSRGENGDLAITNTNRYRRHSILALGGPLGQDTVYVNRSSFQLIR